jgi:NADH-quinone oxidoreductase subunit N
MLLGIISRTPQGFSALVYYVITYALASLGAFGVLGAIENQGVDRLDDIRGLSKRAPGLAFCLLIFLLSLAGIPPLSGFFAKFYIFAATLNAEPHFGLLWLVLLAVAMSAISLYYYLRVLKYAYVAEEAAAAPLTVSPLTQMTLWIIAALVVVFGCAPGLLLNPLTQAIQPLLR